MRAVWMVMWIMAASSVAHAADECDQFKRAAERPDEYTKDAASILSGCDEPNSRLDAEASGGYWLDRPGRPVSEIARVYHVWSCFRSHASALLMCGPDAKRMNRAAYDAEVAKLKLNPEHTASFKKYFDDAQARVKAAQQDLVEHTPAGETWYQKVLEAGDKAFGEWDAVYAANKGLIDAAYAIEDKWWALPPMKRTAVNDLGCDEVRSGWRKWVVGKKFTSAKQLPEAVRSDEVATIALRALALCDGAAGRKMDAAFEVEALLDGFTFRGARSHAAWAAIAAMGKIVPENMAPAMQPLKIYDALFKEAKDSSEYGFNADRDLEQGKIDKITPGQSGLVEVSFKKESWMEPDFNCYDLPTRYWSSSEGHYKHDFACKKVGSHPESSELKPHLFSALSAAGFKPGQVVTMHSGTMGHSEQRSAFPIESRTPEKGGKAKKKGKAADDQIQHGVELQTTGTLEVLYGVPLR